MSQASQPKKYFDLHLTGLGYLSRVREVTTTGNGRAKARPFLACSISALHGDPDVENGIVYLNLDLIVSGEKAKDAIMSVMDHANDREAKVLVGFRAGDHYISTYEIRQGNRAGQMGTVLKGRLLKVFWIKVDGEFVYQDERREDQSDAQTQDQEPEGPASGDDGFDDTDEEVQSPERQPERLHGPRVEEGGQGVRRGSGFLRRAVRRTGTEG